MSLLLNMLSRLVITFLPKSKHLLISWLQSPSAVILEPRKIKSDTVSTVSPSICHDVMGPDAMILVSSCQRGYQFCFPKLMSRQYFRILKRGSPWFKQVKNPLKIFLKRKTNFHFFLVLKLSSWECSKYLSSVHIILQMWRKHTSYLLFTPKLTSPWEDTMWWQFSFLGWKFWFSGHWGQSTGVSHRGPPARLRLL